jgi:hypothetical protein
LVTVIDAQAIITIRYEAGVGRVSCQRGVEKLRKMEVLCMCKKGRHKEISYKNCFI